MKKNSLEKLEKLISDLGEGVMLRPSQWFSSYIKKCKRYSFLKCFKEALILFFASLSYILFFIYYLIAFFVLLIIFVGLVTTSLTTYNTLADFQAYYLNLMIFSIGTAALLASMGRIKKKYYQQISEISSLFMITSCFLFIAFITGFGLIRNVFKPDNWVYALVSVIHPFSVTIAAIFLIAAIFKFLKISIYRYYEIF